MCIACVYVRQSEQIAYEIELKRNDKKRNNSKMDDMDQFTQVSVEIFTVQLLRI